MDFARKFKGTEDFLNKQMKKAGMKIPSEIQNKPQLFKGSELFFEAFLNLNKSRQVSMSAMPISWFDIEKYAESLKLDEQLKFSLHYVIPIVDDFVLAKENK